MENLCTSSRLPFVYALSLIEGKWKLRIIYELACDPVLRYGELRRNISGITHKMLSQQLKELEKDEMITRTEYYQVPPKVEYSLSEKGKSFVPILVNLCEWGKVIN
ncbi:TPA: helix-turn-helix transcriptional regulator [Enterococcus faecalis]|uniref:winged helix-turn-helix transcriptional regulator n=1 Tax=Enterococcus TaxID=1350 RepID=UPI0006652BEE|nr:MULTISPECIES: helix-turn-helix domain-containing protein [Enterococcus]MDK7765393.1 helix-turn-helix domain-containing protein [Enterococcus faecalis]MDN6561623.1 helix-turn-helix transcriptional regulator [Enterococcus sp.]MDN6776495.1 helix-turn-helix transcriptional regulator [Enterococcus sp.]MDV2517210.1 helix-turn-helix domain-containing protein [Enterococcus faecalis]MDV2541875.1 helix-turn-helix domain-containing protein [Enterococcus faecalis]